MRTESGSASIEVLQRRIRVALGKEPGDRLLSGGQDGTTATLSDSHEVGNVLGVPGIEMLIAASEGLPFDLFFVASSCVPAASWEDAGALLGPAEVRQLLAHLRVLGLAEMMDVSAILRGEAERTATGHA